MKLRTLLALPLLAGLALAAPAVASDASATAAFKTANAVMQRDLTALHAAHSDAEADAVADRMAQHSLALFRLWRQKGTFDSACLRRAVGDHVGTLVWAFGSEGIQFKMGHYLKAYRLQKTYLRTRATIALSLDKLDLNAC